MSKGITKLKNGEWRIRVTPVDPATGKRSDKVKTVLAVSEKQAAILRTTFEQEVLTALETKFYGSSNNKTETFAEYCEYWLSHPSHTNRDHVHRRNKNTLKNMILPIIGSVRMKSFTTQHVTFWQAEVQKMTSTTKAGTKSYARQTISKAWRILRSIVNQAGVDGRAEPLICAGMRFSPVGAPEKKKDSLQPDEIQSFFTAADLQPRDIRTMIYVQLTTGCRFGELSALEWSDVDSPNKRLSINKSQFGGDVNAPKNGMSRTVTLMPEVIDLLMEHKAKQKKSKLANVIFPSKTGTYRNPSIMKKILFAVCEKAQIKKNITSHSLRRSVIDNMRRKGVDPFVIRKMVGHATDVMREHYSSPDEVEQAHAQEETFGAHLPN